MLDNGMYVRRVTIRNIRSIAELTWELPAQTCSAGWHVILGDNGSGKSTFLRAIALALMGKKEAGGLRQRWVDWIRVGADTGSIQLAISPIGASSLQDGSPAHPGTGAPFNLIIDRVADDIAFPDAFRAVGNFWVPTAVAGWFCASYGPFRRFTGGDQETQKLFVTQPNLARHLSLFGEGVALTEALTWLQSLKFRQLEQTAGGELLAPILAFVNQPGFLPNGVRLAEVTSSGVQFIDANQCQVLVQDLSDGYRSILSMTFELVRQMAHTFGGSGLFTADATQVVRSGVVIIDEIDAHLHPTWQRTIGDWFRRHFPNVQFIVSTHSPLICQAAEVGSVFRLPRPGVEADRGEMVTGLALKRLLYGNVLDAYGTGAFGDGLTRSDSALEKLDRLAELNTRELFASLSESERLDQAELRSILPTENVGSQSP